MPIVGCSSCRSRFKVPIDTVGKTIRCPKCRTEFQAVALHATPRKRTGSAPIVYAIMGVVALVVAFLMYGSQKRAAQEAEAATLLREREEERARVAEEAALAARKPAAKTAPSTPTDALAQRATRILELLRAGGDNPLLAGWVDFQRIHEERQQAGLEPPGLWNDLPDVTGYAKREEYLDLLMGDDATRAFARGSTVAAAETLSMGSGKGKVALRLQNPASGVAQEVTMHLSGRGGDWLVHTVERGPIGRPGATAQSPAPEPGTSSPVRNRRNLEGDVQAVEPVAGTSASVTQEIERHVTTLKDLSATVEASRARESLVNMGKPAIPYLLNILVPLDLNSPADLQVANRVCLALTLLSGEDYPIVPGGNEASMTGEGAADNERNRRRWFGWWRENSDTYQGPPAPDFGAMDDTEERG